jgi:hypothetical protein
MVHRRELNGEAVIFGNQGDLWNNAMTWFDHDTGSVWSQVTGEAIMGPLKGEQLELMTSTLTTWTDWQDRFPDTLALDAFARQSGLSLDQTAVVVALNDDSLAFPVPALRDAGIVNVEVGGEPVAAVMEAGSDRWIAFSRLVGDRTVEFSLVDGQLVDITTGDAWDPLRGLPLGPYPQLEILPAFSSFPEDYAVFFPDGRVWTPDAIVPADRFRE